MYRFNRGFTLIELLVVIAIIGILAGIVLASLGTARSGATDTKIKGQLSNMRTQAELYSGTAAAIAVHASNNCDLTGSNLFGTSNSGLAPLFVGITTHTCYANATLPRSGGHWMVAAQLSSGNGWWCVDHTGASKPIGARPGTSATACPAS